MLHVFAFCKISKTLWFAKEMITPMHLVVVHKNHDMDNLKSPILSSIWPNCHQYFAIIRSDDLNFRVSTSHIRIVVKLKWNMIIVKDQGWKRDKRMLMERPSRKCQQLCAQGVSLTIILTLTYSKISRIPLPLYNSAQQLMCKVSSVLDNTGWNLLILVLLVLFLHCQY